MDKNFRSILGRFRQSCGEMSTWIAHAGKSLDGETLGVLEKVIGMLTGLLNETGRVTSRAPGKSQPSDKLSDQQKRAALEVFGNDLGGQIVKDAEASLEEVIQASMTRHRAAVAHKGGHVESAFFPTDHKQQPVSDVARHFFDVPATKAKGPGKLFPWEQQRLDQLRAWASFFKRERA